MAFQNFALYPHLQRLREHRQPAAGARGLAEAEIKRKVDEVAALLRIGHVLGHMPRELSNGQKQRTALARALVRGPDVLLLDDPLRNVDAKLRYEMRLELPRLLRELRLDRALRHAGLQGGDGAGRSASPSCSTAASRRSARPAEVYRAPGRRRIARLFGDPTINLYPVRPRPSADGGAEVELFGGTVRLPRGLANIAAAATACSASGPRTSTSQREPSPARVPVELDAVTPLNVRTVLFLRARDGEEILATAGEDAGAALRPRPPRRSARASTSERLLLFDQASGERLAAAA